MTKKDLKNGMIVETRDGTRCLYCDGLLTNSESIRYISDYNDNLTFRNGRFNHLDIVKVYPEPIWKRSSTTELSIKEIEIEILKALDVIGFTHIARSESGNIFAYQSKPVKDWAGVWFFNSDIHPDEMQTIKLKRDLFSFVDWKDKEPTNILNLLSLLN